MPHRAAVALGCLSLVPAACTLPDSETMADLYEEVKRVDTVTADGSDYLGPEYSQCRWEFLIRGAGTVEGYFVNRREGLVSIAGNRYEKFVTVTSGIPGADPGVEFRRRTSQGVFSRSETMDVDEPDRLDIPVPFEAGSTWSSGLGILVGVPLFRAMSVNISVRTCRAEQATLYLPDETHDDTLKVTCDGGGDGGAGRPGLQYVSYWVRGLGNLKSTVSFEETWITSPVVVEMIRTSCER